ncbi:hypothetical protein BDCR2A_00007 [Borrelia duttonii CR2A]|uniref:Uncharacterized protein n=1 Tax=Borrelia duttonii CR2A TaxID=1432657 RepID=W6TL82_9SPIR|nr:hypothetical protein [Borrelia duttonii]ETZ17315.1 hypothetical protein BDCR2A_01763 [Borrelia duttonii CR2A]ETZ18034.1 hypothetical protein BDCR2A_00007 [Borrelia duttonii CR2A]
MSIFNKSINIFILLTVSILGFSKPGDGYEEIFTNDGVTTHFSTYESENSRHSMISTGLYGKDDRKITLSKINMINDKGNDSYHIYNFVVDYRLDPGNPDSFFYKKNYYDYDNCNKVKKEFDLNDKDIINKIKLTFVFDENEKQSIKKEIVKTNNYINPWTFRYQVDKFHTIKIILRDVELPENFLEKLLTHKTLKLRVEIPTSPDPGKLDKTVIYELDKFKTLYEKYKQYFIKS